MSRARDAESFYVMRLNDSDAMSSYCLILIGGEFFSIDFTSFRSQLMSDNEIVFNK